MAVEHANARVKLITSCSSLLHILQIYYKFPTQPVGWSLSFKLCLAVSRTTLLYISRPGRLYPVRVPRLARANANKLTSNVSERDTRINKVHVRCSGTRTH